jgi:pilus assembly protein Flp/PilA
VRAFALSLLSGENGQGLAEYGLILALVAILAVAALGSLSTGINGVLTSIAGSL